MIMANLGNVKKEYNKKNSEVVQEGVIKKEFATEDLPLLTPFDKEINPDFLISMQNSILKAQGIPLDNAVIDQQAAKGVIVDVQVSLSESHFQDIKYFVDKAFPKNNTIKKEFGYNDYSKAKKKPATFVAFLRQLGITVNNYKEPLQDKGMDVTMLTESAKRADALEKASKEHEVSKKVRLLSTQTRTLAHNELWGKIKQLCRAGKRVFKTDYARYRRYILYDGHQTPPPISEDYIILPAGQTATADIEYSNTSVYLFKNAGVTEVRCGRHDKEDEPNTGEGFILTAGAEVVKEALEIPGTGNFINVTNLSTTDSGLFLVQYAE
jgi:hypothetical protein